MLELLRRFSAEAHGGPASEYAVIAAVFALAVLASMTLIRSESTNQLTGTQSGLTNVQIVLPSPTHT